MKITYTDKVALIPPGDRVNQWQDADGNEVKNVVNANDTVDISASNTVFLTQATSGFLHGTYGTPITGNIVVDVTGMVEGGYAVVIFSGDTNPLITGITIQEWWGIITVQDTYLMYLVNIGGRLIVTTPKAGGDDALP